MPVSIPRQSSISKLEWAETFNAAMAANGVVIYGLTLGEVNTINALTVDFRAAFDVAGVIDGVAVNPAGYTQPNRATLFNAEVAAIDTLSAFAVEIQANPAITDAEKLDAGIVPRNFTRPPRTLPAEAPVLAVSSSAPGITRVQSTNALGGISRPSEANGVEFEKRYGVVNGGVTTWGAWGNVDEPVRRNAVVVTNPPFAETQALGFRARYFGSRGQVGPWSAEAVTGNF